MKYFINYSRDWCKKILLSQKFAFTKKSTIFTQSSRDLVKITNSRVGKNAWISACLSKNCGFLLLANFWVSNFFASVSICLIFFQTRYSRHWCIMFVTHIWLGFVFVVTIHTKPKSKNIDSDFFSINLLRCQRGLTSIGNCGT